MNVCVCVSVGCIMFGIAFTFFLLISSLFKTQVDVHFAGLWFKLFVFVYSRSTFVCVSLVCICDVRIFFVAGWPVIQIITNKYSPTRLAIRFNELHVVAKWSTKTY